MLSVKTLLDLFDTVSDDGIPNDKHQQKRCQAAEACEDASDICTQRQK